MTKRVVVIGAGAAGSMAAIFAATAGADTVLVERTRDGGRKILISGGGRCNVLPLRVDESRFVTDSSPNVLRKMVRAWPLAQQRTFFEETLGIPLVDEVESAKVFPASHRARDVRDALLSHARAQGVEMRMETRVTAVAPTAGGWAVSIDNDVPLLCDAVIVATGGLSVPTTGSDGAGLDMLAALGHDMHPTYAALTPLTTQHAAFNELSGVSLTVSLTARSDARQAHATGGFLFTHHGYSGPAVLDVSHVVVRARAEGSTATVQVQWTSLDEAAWEVALKPHGARTVTGALRAVLPDRLAAALLAQAGVDVTRPLSELRREERRALVNTLVRGDLPWHGDEGYKKAEVTGGGVALSEVNPRTMESRRHPGLFLCGEVLDAFGPIGGYNFLWAWATGRAAGIGAADVRPTP
ncbi:MAG: aminoacetone oxidase family FAD-binding enzyme [Gemmatimonadaceae bacterium]|nr:aminoacetone oxidase family FAD-binding enzyme [Gemmatimonadaceae bacterium]